MATDSSAVERGDAGRSTDSTPWTMRETLTWTHKYFADKGLKTARLDAELLLAHALHLRRLDLYLQFDRPLKPDELAAFRALIRRRADGEPVAYIRGVKEFWSREFAVSPAVLIPRPETEVLVEEALARIPANGANMTVLDIGTGSGCIAVTLAAERSALTVVATDISADALAIAARNADTHGVGSRVNFREGDLFSGVETERFDLLVSNPPYVEAEKFPGLDPGVRMEPRGALFGGEGGLDILRPLIAGARDHLKPGGWLLVEIGAEQADAVSALFSEAGLQDVSARKDYAGLPRVVMGRNS